MYPGDTDDFPRAGGADNLALSDYGVRQQRHNGCDEAEARRVLADEVVPRLRDVLAARAGKK